MARRPLGLISGPLKALLPETVQLLAFALQVRGGFQRDRQGSRFERLEDPLTYEGVHRPAGKVLAIVSPVVGRQAVTGVTMQLPRAPVAHLHPVAASAAHQEPSQQGRAMADR